MELDVVCGPKGLVGEPDTLYRNNGDGTFSAIGLASGLALNGDGKPQASMGVDAADYDGDGRLDVFVTNFSQDYNTLC